MSDTKTITVSKIGAGPPPLPKHDMKSRKAPIVKEKKPKYGILKGGKTARKKPRFEGVKDPAKAPPLRKSSKLRILTDKGQATRRAKIVEDSKHMSLSKMRATLRKSGLPIKDSSPESLTRKIYEDAQEAGMISST